MMPVWVSELRMALRFACLISRHRLNISQALFPTLAASASLVLAGVFKPIADSPPSA